MAKLSRYRWPTIIIAGVAITLSCFCIWWVFIIFSHYRTPDFTSASAGSIQGTCIEGVSTKQLNSWGLDKTDWTCSGDSKKQLANLLAASVHAMYASNNKSAFAGADKDVFDAVVGVSQGDTVTYEITNAAAYSALALIGTPYTTDCATLYAGATEGTFAALSKPTVVCTPDVAIANNAHTVTADVDKLYTHCLEQFSYARSWPDSGTFGIPVAGKEPKPVLLSLTSTNSSTTWEETSRVLVGTRWGYSTIPYLIFMMATGFFLLDATVLLLAELTRVRTIAFRAQFGFDLHTPLTHTCTPRFGAGGRLLRYTTPLRTRFLSFHRSDCVLVSTAAQNALVVGTAQSMKEGVGITHSNASSGMPKSNASPPPPPSPRARR